VKITDLFKEAICETSSWVLTRVMWLSILLWTYNGSLQKREYLISIKGQTNWVASQIGLYLRCKAWLNCGKDKWWRD
jgi:hypothetical protein